MKTVHVVMYSALLLFFGSACSQAQQSPESTRSSKSNADSQGVSGATITGAGKTNYVPVWLSGTELGNSNIFQLSGEIGVGTTTPAATLDVNGTVNAATGYNLGGIPVVSGSVTLDNIFIGGGGNSAITGSGNFTFGAGSLVKDTTGYYNTAMGVATLNANTTGYGNAAFGADALQHNTGGSINTALGDEALQANTTGSENTAVGIAALEDNITGSEDTATGYGALFQNTTGPYNVADGLLAGGSNTTGAGNTAIGFAALYASNTTGNFNTALGYYAGPDKLSTNLSHATAIGAGAVVSQSNALVLGGPLGSGANVNVGIGTATPSNVFTIAQGAGQAIADGWATYSSRRWKSNIETLHNALEKVEQLRGVSYDLQANGKHEVGVIAEEVGAIVPEVVTWDKNGKDAQSVDYSRLTALLIEATKEQQVLIQQQQEQIAQLMSQVKTIQASLKTSGRAGSEVRTVSADLGTVRQ